MNLDLLLGFTNIRRTDKKNTHKLPAKNIPPIDNEIAGFTFGRNNKVNEPSTQIKVNGANNKPKGIVTHLGKGSDSSS